MYAVIAAVRSVFAREGSTEALQCRIATRIYHS